MDIAAKQRTGLLLMESLLEVKDARVIVLGNFGTESPLCLHLRIPTKKYELQFTRVPVDLFEGFGICLFEVLRAFVLEIFVLILSNHEISVLLHELVTDKIRRIYIHPIITLQFCNILK